MAVMNQPVSSCLWCNLKCLIHQEIRFVGEILLIIFDRVTFHWLSDLTDLVSDFRFMRGISWQSAITHPTIKQDLIT